MLSKENIQDMQRQLGVNPDGVLGRQTIMALQRKIGVRADGVIGPATITGLKKSGATLWAAEFQQQLSDAKGFFTGKKSALHGGKTPPPKPKPFVVPSPPAVLAFDLRKMGLAAVGILVCGFVAMAASSGKRASA